MVCVSLFFLKCVDRLGIAIKLATIRHLVRNWLGITATVDSCEQKIRRVMKVYVVLDWCVGGTKKTTTCFYIMIN